GLCIQAEGKNFRITCPEFPAMLPAYWYHANRKHRKGKDSRRAFIWGYTRWQVETALECYGSYVPDATFFGSVEDYCRQHGYVCSNDEWDNRTVNWEKEYPKKKRILFSVFAQPWGQYQVMHTVRVSDFQIVFAEFASMSDGLKQMIMDKASRCSGCRYCVQTDKSGTKPLAASHVTHNGVDKVICSYYPFWSLREISSERADQLIELMSIAERVLADKYGARAK
ncbi:MAG: hypothetical protein FWE76_07620, partial [Symbiobacteriaceae bacterium]|nr:hypothetical protein [Symbiobacteriaceae bacterium]